MNWQLLLLIAGGLVMLFLLYRYVSGNPQAFSSENLTKSFGTMGILALALIAFVAFLVMLVRTT